MDSGKVMTSDTDLGSDMDTSENLGHGFGLGQLSDTRVRPTLIWMLVKKIWDSKRSILLFKNRYLKERWLILVIFIALAQWKRFVYNEEDGKFHLANQNSSFIFLS